MLVKLLETDEEREDVYKLVYKEYLKAGYITPREDERFVHYAGLLDKIPQTDVFVVYDSDKLVGTNSLTRDSENGMHVCADFPLQVMRERNTGKSLVASWRIVVDSSHRDKDTVRQLIRACLYRGVALGVETWLYSFHPKHALAYMRFLNAEVIGFSESTDGLHNAPALLLRGYTKDIPKWWFFEH